MKALVFPARGRVLALVLCAAFLAACQVVPPEQGVATRSGWVRAHSTARANEVAAMLVRLEPEVVALIPEARTHAVDVWVQETPALYRFATRAYQDADGFYTDAEQRIHLREHADSLERTLAHELVHAHLRGAWSALPGTMEEGLCDHVSGELCPSARARLRAGRLSCAAFALGGLSLDLCLRIPAAFHPAGIAVSFQARLRLEGDPPMDVDPMGVFERQAGLSSSSMSTPHKKAYYGLAYLVVERVVERRGLTGLHAMCKRAHADESKLASDDVLDAAGLTRDPETWRTALAGQIEPDDLRELVRAHPEFLVHALDEFFSPCLTVDELASAMPGLEAELVVAGTDTRVSLLSIGEVSRGLADLWAARGSAQLASH